MNRLVEFAGLAAVIIAIPGPSVLFTVSRALTAGRRAALLTVAGNEIGLLIQAAAVAFGVGALVERSAQVFTVIKLAGAAYLVYLGVQAIRHRRSLAEAITAHDNTATRPLRALSDGLIVGTTNPKTIVFFVAVLPQFVARGSGAAVQMMLLGAVFSTIALILDSVWALAAGTAGQWLARSPRRMSVIGGAGGLAMIGIGLSLAVTGRKD